MLRVFKTSFIVFIMLVLGGCASMLNEKMIPDKKSKSEDVQDKSIALLTVEISRQEKSRFTPEPMIVHAVDMQVNQEKKRKITGYAIDGTAEISNPKNEDQKIYLIRLPLTPGKHSVGGISGVAKAFPIVGSFHISLGIPLDIESGKVAYFGRIKAILRPKKDDKEIAAGSIVPLIDQAVAGISKGTFERDLLDNYEEDILLMKERMPALNQLQILNKTPSVRWTTYSINPAFVGTKQ